jgi:flagellar biogenesis protein FliO
MIKSLCSLVILLLCFLTTISYAQEALIENENEITKQSVEKPLADPLLVNQAPEVGKHVMANTDAGSMILSLLMVLALIGISAFVLKRFNVTQQHNGQLKVVAAQQITLLKSLEEPINSNNAENTSALAGNVLAFLKKTNFNTKKT